jgi:hypothetical protein
MPEIGGLDFVKRPLKPAGVFNLVQTSLSGTTYVVRVHF